MELIHPAALWGLLCIAVPIIIHLITRRRALRKPFAAIQFVLLSYQKVRRRLRLKRILILLARALAVAMLAMMIARPTVPSRGGAMNMGMGSRSLVIVIDNTMSMTQKDGGETPFDRAKKTAKAVIASLGPNQEAAVMAVDSEMMERPDGAMLRADPEPLEKALDSIKVSWSYRSIQPVINAAADIARGGRYPLKQVLIITDLQKADWEGGGDIASSGVDALVLDVGPRESLPNAAITNMQLRPAAGEARYEAAVDVAAFSKTPMPGREVVIRVADEDRARGFMDLPADGSAHKELTFSSTGKGLLHGMAHISPDALDADNERYFTARAGGNISTVVIDGDPKPERYGAESYYIMNALNPRLETRSRIEPTLMTASEFENASLKGTDLVILANVGGLRGKAAMQLRQFVENGGVIIFSLGDQIDPKGFQSAFGDLVPAPLYIVKEPTDPGGIRLDPIRDDHPATALFRRPGGGDLTLAKFHKYFLIDTAGAPGGLKTVLSYSDGAPAIVERSYKLGKVAMFTSTLDRDWNDLCIFPTYLPLLQQLALFLTGGMSDPEGAGLSAGSRARFQCGGSATNAIVILPGGERREIRLTASADERAGEIAADRGPGFYTVYCLPPGSSSIASGQEPDRALAVNVDTRESNLLRWNRDDLEKILSKGGGAKVAVATDISALASTGGFTEERNEIWKTLLALMIGLLFIEGLLTRNG